MLPGNAQRFLKLYSAALGLLSILDAVALGLLAIVMSPIVSGQALTIPVIGKVGDEGLVILLGLVCLLIILKGVLALALSWRATRVFARYELDIGSRLFDSYIQSSWVDRLKRNSADVVRLTDSSVSATVS